MATRRRVALGMSGGVDSAVSAALLARAGYEVVGVTCVFQRDAAGECSVRDAAAVCRRLGIAHVEHDCADLFAREVVEPFVDAYAQGLTPSPCVKCNANAKIPALLAAADEHGCDSIAAGHYARIVQVPAGRAEGSTCPTSLSTSAEPAGRDVKPAESFDFAAPSNEFAGASPLRFAVMRALDARKDQSYMLAMLSQEQLSRLVLPLGAMTKVDVRLMAADLGLEVAEKPDSQDICFIDGDYRDFLRTHGVADAPGSIVDRAGRVLGEHAGLSSYTIGQRKGIGVAAPEPYYVLAKRPCDNALVVGFAEEARIGGVVARDVNWQALATLDEPRDAMVKLRYRSTAAACIMEPWENGRVRVRLRSPQQATAPGQFVVFYQGDTVLGGGMIEEVLA